MTITVVGHPDFPGGTGNEVSLGDNIEEGVDTDHRILCKAFVGVVRLHLHFKEIERPQHLF